MAQNQGNGFERIANPTNDAGEPTSGSGLGADIIDYFTGKYSQMREAQYQDYFLEKQMDFDREMWEKENEYNSTANQLKRWIEAGGNPNAFFGGGTNTGNASSVSAPSGAAVGSTIGVLQNAMNSTMAAAKTFWENRKLKAEAQGQEIENGTLRELNLARIKEIQGHVALMEKQGKLTEWQAKQIMKLLPGLEGKTNAEIDQIREQTNLLMEQTKESKARRHNLNADTRVKVQQKLKLEWEKTFREQFGVDPTASPIQMLIQNILQGKGEDVLAKIFQYIQGAEDTIPEMVPELIPKKFNPENWSNEAKIGKKIGKNLGTAIENTVAPWKPVVRGINKIIKKRKSRDKDFSGRW